MLCGPALGRNALTSRALDVDSVADVGPGFGTPGVGEDPDLRGPLSMNKGIPDLCAGKQVVDEEREMNVGHLVEKFARTIWCSPADFESHLVLRSRGPSRKEGKIFEASNAVRRLIVRRLPEAHGCGRLQALPQVKTSDVQTNLACLVCRLNLPSRRPNVPLTPNEVKAGDARSQKRGQRELGKPHGQLQSVRYTIEINVALP